MILKENRTTEQVSQMMSVSCSALRRWKSQYRQEQQGITPKVPAISAEQLEIQQFRAANEQLRSDNTLLKKVSAFLLEKS
ncbi:hypothetical protein A4G18_07585 [Pasteurellaceae bacterium Pebbles2]|nr:hypothetical protein [Pasteurellaceae bacterium Pebbles2]